MGRLLNIILRNSCTVLALAAGLSGCATNPVTGDKDFVLLSESEEISLGRRYHQDILREMSVYQDPDLAAYVSRVGQRVASASHRPGLNYQFTVIDSSDVNAFALPGGYIYITRGLLAYLNSEAELAAVLGHEIGHVTARHAVRQHSASTAAGVAGAILQATTGVQGSQDLFNVFGKAILSGYGREHELESDRLGAQYLARTGYDPQAMLKVIGVLKNQELFERQRAREENREPRAYHGVFASHPDNDRRLQEVVSEANRLRNGSGTRIGREDYLSEIDGLRFGDSENDGVIRGTRFIHGPLDFTLTFPEGWDIENRPDRLIARSPQQSAYLEVRVEPLKKRISQHRFLQQKGVRNIRNGVPLAVSGFDTYSANAPVSTSLGARMARFIVLYDGDHAYLFTGISRDPRGLEHFDPAFEDVARSYRKLTPAERRLADGLKIDLQTASRNTFFADLARSSPIPEYPERQLRLLNDMYPGGEPRAGQTIKVVR